MIFVRVLQISTNIIVVGETIFIHTLKLETSILIDAVGSNTC